MTTRDHRTRRQARRGDVDEQPRTNAELLDDTLSDLSRHTSALYRWLPLIRDMADTHRENGLGFVPEATRQAIGRQHARDRHERRLAVAAGGAVASGESRAPGNLTSWGLEADIATTLRHQVRFIVRQSHRPDCAVYRAARAACTCDVLTRLALPTRREGETTEDVVHRFRTAAMQITTLRLATTVLVDVEHLAEAARHTLFGEDRTQLGAECPHCGRRTLVVYLQTGVIACERPRDVVGRAQPCTCTDRLCPCHVDARFEHQWLRDRPPIHPRSWQTFAGVLKQNTIRKDTR